MPFYVNKFSGWKSVRHRTPNGQICREAAEQQEHSGPAGGREAPPQHHHHHDHLGQQVISPPDLDRNTGGGMKCFLHLYTWLQVW